MTTKIFVDRSRYETGLTCGRRRWYEYHEGIAHMGIVSVKKPLPLCVGSSVHVGLATLLVNAQACMNNERMRDDLSLPKKNWWLEIEEKAVAAALADFAQYESAIDVDTGEIASRATLPADAPALSEMDEYLYREQCALVEAMVRAYARRRLRSLLEQFEVLEVEREGEWLLSSWQDDGVYVFVKCSVACSQWDGSGFDSNHPYPHKCPGCGAPTIQDDNARELWFMSRPDALLRERESSQLYLLSFKTTAAWDIRKARDAEHDMQGMSEGIEIERRLAQWWEWVKQSPDSVAHYISGANIKRDTIMPSMVSFLNSCDAPPRILAVRYEFLLKGERWKDKELSARFGCEMRSQKSHLIRAYEAVSVPMRGAAGYNIGDRCWSYDYIRDDGRDSSLAWQNFKSRPVWETGTVKAWIDALDTAAETMSGEDSTVGMEPRLLGYKCDAQAVGVTREHPLDAAFVSPITVYRSEDELRDLVEQIEAVERRVAEGAAAVHAAKDEGEKRHLLNTNFPMNRHACEFPSTCQYSKGICYASDEAKRDPIATGMYKIRVANHPQEMEGKL